MPVPAQAKDFVSALPPRLAQCAATAKAPAPVTEYSRDAIHVSLHDGVRLAVDVLKPAGSEGKKLPAIYVSTRYGRSAIGKDASSEYRGWLAQGYAVVLADVRGTGASFGTWYIPYSRQEAEDVGELANWIAAQPWSNGRVATTGTSYPGTTALISPAFGSPAVKASVPRFSDFDMYSDLLFPGGTVAEDLIVTWGRFVREMDLNQNRPGVRPVDGADGAKLLAQAVEEHRRNEWSFETAAEDVTSRDEVLKRFGGLSIDEAGTFHLRERIEASGVPIFGWASWLDSGTAQGLVNRFAGWSNPQVSIIGAWSHGAGYDSDPFKPVDQPLEVPRALQEQLYSCFIAPYMQGRTVSPDHLLIYYTMGEDQWKTTKSWPLASTRMQKFYLGANGTLTGKSGTASASDAYKVDFTATTGKTTRWATQASGDDVVYPERAEADRQLLVYTSAPLETDMEVTGHGLVSLQLTSSQPDGAVFAYLEDVAPDGRVTYVTEGQLRMLHRKIAKDGGPYKTSYPQQSFKREDAAPMRPGAIEMLRFQLLPTSVLFRKGHRIRIAFAGADAGNFKRMPASGDASWRVARGGKQASYIELPIIPRK
jgi:putative CocE/NonD family hydrolase